MLYQLIIHAYSEANIRNFFFFANFPLVSSFQCEASGRSLLASRRMRLRCPDSKGTRPNARGLSHAYVATHVQTG
jgi:hypothetical protein